MDNLTHSLLGLTAAKAGLERLSPGATTLCILAANSPDCDVAILLTGDRWTYLHHHRGITHAIVGVIVLALLMPLIFYGVDRLWARFRRQPPKTKLRGLLLASTIVTATHPILDWTNNYGIRPFLPWSSQWFYGDLVYIVDPHLWLTLGGACFLLSKTKVSKIIWAAIAVLLTTLVIISPRSANLPFWFNYLWVGSLLILVVLFALRAGQRWGSKIAVIALVLVVVYWSFLGFAHSRAVDNAHEQAARVVVPGETILRSAVMPTLASPLHWDCVFETDRAAYRFSIRLMGFNNFPTSKVVRYEKPSGDLAAVMEKVSTERPVQIFLGFARFPVARLADPHCTTQTLVQLADLRYTEPGRSRGTFALELPVECPTSDEGGR